METIMSMQWRCFALLHHYNSQFFISLMNEHKLSILGLSMWKKAKSLVAFLLIFQCLGSVFFNFSADASSNFVSEEICMEDTMTIPLSVVSEIDEPRADAFFFVWKRYESLHPFHFQSYLESVERPPKFTELG